MKIFFILTAIVTYYKFSSVHIVVSEMIPFLLIGFYEISRHIVQVYIKKKLRKVIIKLFKTQLQKPKYSDGC